MEHFQCEFKSSDISEAGIFSGYGAVFGNIDAYGDVIAPGAFKSTLESYHKAGKYPPMLLQHGGLGARDNDGLPIGVWTAMAEDNEGLKVEGKLVGMETEVVKRVYSLMKEGALDGLSIGYRAKEFSLGAKVGDPRRMLKGVDLVEVSVVTFPANSKARVGSVKGFDAFNEQFLNIKSILARNVSIINSVRS